MSPAKAATAIRAANSSSLSLKQRSDVRGHPPSPERPFPRVYLCACQVGELSTAPSLEWEREVRARHSGKGHALVEACCDIVAPVWGKP